jgi:hypothetical protein
VRVIKRAVERPSRVGVQERALNLIVAVAVRQRCVVGLTARQVIVLRLAIAIVSTSLISMLIAGMQAKRGLGCLSTGSGGSQ